MLKKWLILSSLIISSLSAATVPGGFNDRDDQPKVDLEVTQGYRVDRNTWSMAGPHKKPNTLLEIKNKHIRIYQTRLNASVMSNDAFGRLQLGYGDVIKGSLRGSMYERNNKRGEVYRAVEKIKGSYVWDGRVSFGKMFHVRSDWSISPLIGYQWQKEKLKTRSGEQKIPERHKIKHAKSVYKSTWDAPFIGALAAVKLSDTVGLFAEYNFFAAVRNTSKGTEKHHLGFKSKSHRRKGFGNMGNVGLAFKLSDRLSLGAEYQLAHFVARGGKAKSVPSHSKERLPMRRASLTSSEVRLSLNYAF
jgi:opacity protein-like surface antigen